MDYQYETAMQRQEWRAIRQARIDKVKAALTEALRFIGDTKDLHDSAWPTAQMLRDALKELETYK